MWCQGGLCSLPSALSHLIIHRAFQTKEEFFFFLAHMLPFSISTSSICCYICCSSSALGVTSCGVSGLHYCGSICLEISKLEVVISPRVVMEVTGKIFFCCFLGLL